MSIQSYDNMKIKPRFNLKVETYLHQLPKLRLHRRRGLWSVAHRRGSAQHVFFHLRRDAR